MDEGTLVSGTIKRRKQKIYHDVLGRVVKTEIYDWNNSVYMTTTHAYNVLDQTTTITRQQGSGGASQVTTFSYDGHGRLSTRQFPSASAPSSFVYNADDTLQTVTDARGASSAFSYNNRHKVTAITYGAPDGVAATPNVTFGYDEAGNRTSMTDGLGSATYHYDTLSRMDWETRVITGVGSFTINYAYNLGGQLTSVTDPANDSVNYVYNNAGSLAAINGSNYGGVTQYASGLQFRAWGGIKALSYGNGLSLANSYDSRLQLQQMEVKGFVSSGSPSLMKIQYQYYPDGTSKYTKDLMDSRFDRAWAYDHVGRLSVAYTGQEADNYAGVSVPIPQTGPYQHTHQYDVWNNLTSRAGRYWSQTSDFTTTYNGQNQRQGWTYDASGNLLNDTTNQYVYDAAGRNVSAIGVGQAVGVTQSFDGLGRTIKHAKPGNLVTYYLYSTPLGGQLLTELFGGAPGPSPPLGSKVRGYVYAGEVLIARQEKIGGVRAVEWEHHDDLTGSLATSRNGTISNGSFSKKREPDPMGADVGLMDPLEVPPLPEPGEIGFELVDDALFPDGRCTVDGMIIGCATAAKVLQSGAAVIGPQQTTRWNFTTKSFEHFRATAEGSGWADAKGNWVEKSRSYEWVAKQDVKDANGVIIHPKGELVITIEGEDRWEAESRQREYVSLAAGEFIVGGGLFQSKKPGFPIERKKNPSTPKSTCIVTLGSRGLNYPGMQRVFHHMFITTQTWSGAASIPTVFQGIHPDLYLRVQENEFKAGNDDYDQSRNPGAIFVQATVPGTCDEVNASFGATMKAINDANILYENPTGTRIAPGITTPGNPRNSNAVAYTLLQRWSPEWRGKLEGKYRQESGRPFSLFAPGWNKLLVK